MNKLAIIIPYFKSNFFEKTLESLANQTDKRFSVYIGDDASPVAPTELLDKYQGKFNYYYTRFSENLGSKSLTKQWDRCIDMIQGEEWFMILGDDDVLGENVVKEFNNNFIEINKKYNVIRYSTQVIDGLDNPISKEYHHPKLENAIESYCKKLMGFSRSSLSEYVFRKSSYQKYSFKNYKLAWGSDDRAVIDFCENKPIFSIPTLVYVRISNLSISGNANINKEKVEAKLKFTKDLIYCYRKEMNIKQLEIILFDYEFYVFSLGNLNRFKHFLTLFYLTFRYRGFFSTLKIFKSFLKSEYFDKN